MERFISFGWGKLKPIDSIVVMSESLEKLVENLKDGDTELSNFENLKKDFREDAELLCKKGLCPYEWVDCDKKLNYFKDTFQRKISI